MRKLIVKLILDQVRRLETEKKLEEHVQITFLTVFFLV